MKNPDLRRLKTAINLIEIGLEHMPEADCDSPYKCTSCNPLCKAASAVHAALYWVQDVAKRLDDQEKQGEKPKNESS